MHVDAGQGIVHGCRRHWVFEELQKHGQGRRSRKLEIVGDEALLERGDDTGPFHVKRSRGRKGDRVRWRSVGASGRAPTAFARDDPWAAEPTGTVSRETVASAVASVGRLETNAATRGGDTRHRLSGCFDRADGPHPSAMRRPGARWGGSSVRRGGADDAYGASGGVDHLAQRSERGAETVSRETVQRSRELSGTRPLDRRKRAVVLRGCARLRAGRGRFT